MKLSIEAAKALQPGETLKDHDPKYKGLELRARAAVKSWHFYYRTADGTQRRPKIGEFPGVSIDAARAVVKEWKQRIAKGEDVSAERQATRDAPTVADLVKHYLDNYAEPNYAKTTYVCAESLMRLFVVPELGSIRVSALTVEDCNGLFERIAAGSITIDAKVRGGFKKRKCAPSKTNANSCRRYLAKALQLAEGNSLKWRPRGSNPCHDEETTSFPTVARRVHIHTNEFEALNKALRELAATYPIHVACIYVVLLCGTRLTEMATARREWLHADEFGNRDLVLTEHKTAADMGDTRIAIPAAAAVIIDGLPVHRNGFIFGELAEVVSPRRALWRVWKMARDRSGVRVDIEARDLRRTFASVARTLGAKIEDIQPLLRHASPATTEGYAYLFGDASRKLAEDTAGKIGTLLEGPKK